MTLPTNLPAPQDDGACKHLAGMTLPALKLYSTEDRAVTVSEAASRLAVFFFYPRSGRPNEPVPEGWDQIPGARGCTPQSCGFRDVYDQFKRLRVQVFGVSSQSTEFQKEFVERMELPYEILSDEYFALTEALRLPTFEFNGMRLIKRLAIVAEKGRIVKVFYPVFPPDRNAEEVLTWLATRGGRGPAL